MNRLATLTAFAIGLAGCGADDSGPVAPAGGGLPGAGNAATAANAAPVPVATPQTEAVAIIAEEFAYGATDDRNYIGYFATPADIIEPPPGVVLVHERWGLNDSIRQRARALAEAGFAVLAVDLYGREIANDAGVAQTLSSTALSERDASLDNIGQGIDYLRAYALAPRVALLGYGLGGGLVLEAALGMSEKIDAVVMYYGPLGYDEASLEPLRAPLLGFFGENDESIVIPSVQAFRAALLANDADAEVIVELGVGHGFADPDRATFDRRVAEESWAETLAFLERTIRQASR